LTVLSDCFLILILIFYQIIIFYGVRIKDFSVKFNVFLAEERFFAEKSIGYGKSAPGIDYLQFFRGKVLPTYVGKFSYVIMYFWNFSGEKISFSRTFFGVQIFAERY
jgi:hypothetical protein